MQGFFESMQDLRMTLSNYQGTEPTRTLTPDFSPISIVWTQILLLVGFFVLFCFKGKTLTGVMFLSATKFKSQLTCDWPVAGGDAHIGGS